MMAQINIKVITPSEIKKKIKEKEKFVIYFTRNNFFFFEAVQKIFFRNNVGWFASGCNLLDLELENYGLVLYFDGKALTFNDIDSLNYTSEENENVIYEEYIFSPFDKKKKLLI